MPIHLFTCFLSKTGISGDNLSNISRAVFLITEENEDITVTDIGLLVDILQQISYLNSTDANVSFTG